MQAERHATLSLGFSEAAQKLGLVGGSDTSSSHAQAADAELASQLASLDMVATEDAQHAQQGARELPTQHAEQAQQAQLNGTANGAAGTIAAGLEGAGAGAAAADSGGGAPTEAAAAAAAAYSRNIEYLRYRYAVPRCGRRCMQEGRLVLPPLTMPDGLQGARLLTPWGEN